jgi:deoxyadenosine/deoxycytidine kinase
MPLRIAISGPTASGKTTLARLMAQGDHTGIVAEPQPVDLLASFSRSPREYCQALQLAIIRGRATNAREHATRQVIVFDRTVREDIEIFIRLHQRHGFLDAKQVSHLVSVAMDVEAEIGPPDVYVLTTAEPSVLRDRLGTESPPRPIIESLEEQLALYRRWTDLLRAPRLLLDTTRRTLGDLEHIAKWILGTALDVQSGNAPENKVFAVAWLPAEAQ